MESSNRLRLLVGSALGITALIQAPSASAQSCVLCYTSVAGGGPAVIRAFTFGVLTLLIPALTLCIAIALLIVHRVRTAARSELAPAAASAVCPPGSRQPILARLRMIPQA